MDKNNLLQNFAAEFHPLVELGQKYGPDIIDIVMARLGGEKPHIPTQENFWGMLNREVRNEQIRLAFNGTNYDDLGEQHGLHPNQVRNIVHSKRRLPAARGEANAVIKIDTALHQRLLVENARYHVSLRELASTLITLALNNDDIRDALHRRFGEQLQLPANEELRVTDDAPKVMGQS